MSNERGKSIDNTHLSIDTAEERGFIHRDYIAHCFRWSHVAKFMGQGRRHATSRLLDVGCGREIPLARLLFSSRMTHGDGGSYTAVDYNKLEWPSTIPADTSKFNLRLVGGRDFTDADVLAGEEPFDVAVSFEMLEHVEPAKSFATIKKIRSLVSDDATVFLSTPCFDPAVGAADNHVNEMTYFAMKWLVRMAGFDIEASYGTFASQKDYVSRMTEAQMEVFQSLVDYYDSNIVACMFAPLFPDRSRNALWRLRPAEPPIRPDVAVIEALKHERQSSSDQWVSDVTKIVEETQWSQQ